MNIHFLAATKGGRQLYETYKEIVAVLEQHGTIHGKHLTKSDLTSHGETTLSSKDILERELSELREADFVVAEVTTPSLGVGYMLGKAEEAQKHIICLYQGENFDKLSAMIRGNEHLTVHLYKTKEDLEQIFSREIKFIKTN